jgi:hypothetical protein
MLSVSAEKLKQQNPVAIILPESVSELPFFLPYHASKVRFNCTI